MATAHLDICVPIRKVTDCLVGKLSSAVLSLTGAQGHDQIGTPSMQCCNYDKPERKLTQH